MDIQASRQLHFKNYFAGATSAYNPAGAADAWLVTKAIEIPDSGYVLSWKSEALNLNKRDGLQVYISERGGNPETDFGEPVWQIDEEQAGPTESIDGEWQEHSLPLDSYAGKTIYVAFVNRSTDKSIICLDDVMISCPRPYIVSLDMKPMYAADEIEIRGHITPAILQSRNMTYITPRLTRLYAQSIMQDSTYNRAKAIRSYSQQNLNQPKKAFTRNLRCGLT